jgi:transglutaminase-like putative cysteine protease
MLTAIPEQVEAFEAEEEKPGIQIRIGYELIFECCQATPVILILGERLSPDQKMVVPVVLTTDPPVPLSAYRDCFGNPCTRLIAPPGRITITGCGVVRDSGLRDKIAPWACQHPVPELPEETLLFLLGSRYCETDRFAQIAWSLFGQSPQGWPRVQAICDFVHANIRFGYEFARPTKTAWETFQEGTGVCRDMAHLAITFCRCMNIPARYCTGYLGDIGVPPVDAPMDFAGWFEAYLGGRWYAFDPRNHIPRIGRILIAFGRDAGDVAISNTFGPAALVGFRVQTDQILGTWPASEDSRGEIQAAISATRSRETFFE